MIKSLDVFHEIPCLTEKSSRLNGTKLQKKWFKSADKRIIGQYLQKFINYNIREFRFLGVDPYILGTDQNTSIAFRTSGFIGTIPLRASDTGKQIGDFVVTPRYTGSDRFEDYIEILNILDADISPQIMDSLPLASGRNFRPPLYLEAIKFINSLEKLISKSWRKFNNVEKISNQPTGRINWTKFIDNEYRVEKRLRYPVKANVLNEFHGEYSQIRYVFDICKTELLSANTPQRIKTNLRNKLIFIEEKLYHHKPIISKKIKISFSDSPTVKICKERANKILNFNLADSTAWRVDFSDVFEKFVQHIFKLAAKETGGRLYSNHKINSTTLKRYSWELRHVEPDAIFQKENLLLFIDAKYKSNLYNKFNDSELLKEDHRKDLHQIMAYSSFSEMNNKYGFICYPSNKVEVKKIKYNNNINRNTINIFLIGIPLKKESIDETKRMILRKINEIEKIELSHYQTV